MDWQRTPSINKFDWPTDFVLRKAAENRHASEARRRALMIRGKDIREYTSVLQNEVRKSGGYVLNGPEDAASFILGGAGEFQNYELKRIFDPIKSDSVERFKGNIDNLGFDSSIVDIAKLFTGDGVLGNESLLKKYIDAVRKSASDKTILYFPSGYISRNFDVLFAQTIKASTGSYWLIAGEMEGLTNYGVESIERPYLDLGNLRDSFASMLSVAPDDVSNMIASTRPISAFDANRMTIRDFNEAIRYYWRSAERYAFPEGPAIPTPTRAPLQFRADVRGISVQTPTELNAEKEALPAAAEEVLENLRDVKNHHGISNAAPALSSKLERIESHLVAMLNGADDASVIRLGIATQAAYEQAKYEGENVSSSSLGAVNAALAAVSLLLQRIEVWQEYLEGGTNFRVNLDVVSADRAEISSVLTDLVATPGLLDQRSEAAVVQYRADLNMTVCTAAEQSGLIRVGQNLASVVARFLRDVVGRAGKAVVDGVYELPKAGVTALMVTFLIRNGSSWQALAERYPLIFGWMNGFVSWLSSLNA